MSPPVQVPPADEHNEILVRNVHPPDWANPRPAEKYHLVIIGAGTAGLVTAAAAAGLGAKVALIERHLMGGDCLNVGCVPSKALLRAARAAAEARRAAEFGIHVGDVRVDFPAVMERLRRVRAALSPHDSARRFRELGVDVFLGEAAFRGEGVIEVAGQMLRFSKAVIATGARAAAPPIAGLDQIDYLTNENVFQLTELPTRLAVVGAGPIGCELAQAFARLGSKVSLLETEQRILGKEDPDAVEIVAHALQRDGVELRTSSKITNVARENGGTVVRFERNGVEERRTVDRVLIGVGRQPNVEGLSLEAVGVEYDSRRGVTVNDKLQTTNRTIYAAGDVCSQYKFTHLADFQARIVVQNALFPLGRKASSLTVPWCTYTSPEIAHVGMYEHEAREKGIDLRTFVQKLSEVDRAVIDGADEGFIKVHVKKGSDKILGATIVAEHAGDTISEISTAMAAGIGLKRIADVIHPYPTQAEAIRKLGDQYNRTRLTGPARWLLRKWLAWR